MSEIVSVDCPGCGAVLKITVSPWSMQVQKQREVDLAEMERLEAENERLRAELENIANAKPHEWGSDHLQQFREWAQNRARHALKGGEAVIRESPRHGKPVVGAAVRNLLEIHELARRATEALQGGDYDGVEIKCWDWDEALAVKAHIPLELWPKVRVSWMDFLSGRILRLEYRR